MSEGTFSGEPVATGEPASPQPTPQGGYGLPDPTTAAWGKKDESPTPPARSRRFLVMAVVTLVIGLPICVGVLAYMSPSRASGDQVDADGSVGDLRAGAGSDEVGFSPRWTRPSWADSMRGMTAFELPADSDVPFGNGRLRPTLGVTCAGGRTDVHVVTEGTAIVDPETSGHVVHLTFDEASEQTQQWAAADDMRALFAPAPFAIANQIKRSRRLRFGFSHYVTGPTVVEFDLRGADAVIESMAEPCGWDGSVFSTRNETP